MNQWLEKLVILLIMIYFLDRAWKMVCIYLFFKRQKPYMPPDWPRLSLVQPITKSPNDLHAVLAIRAANPYPGVIEHILVFDEQDVGSQDHCRKLSVLYPGWNPKIVLVNSETGIASKTTKQLAGLQYANGGVFCFIDDDILLRKDTLEILVTHLQAGVGAVFGLACYTNWHSVWGGLMSAFVNANALANYIPPTYLADPFSIIGHIYALNAAIFTRIGGLNGMEERLDDDHELARRVMKHGLLNVQTPAIYDVDNELPNSKAFAAQLKRWFVFPREMMLPGAGLSASLLTYLTSLPNLLPMLVLVLAIFAGENAWLGLIPVVFFYGMLIICDRAYLGTKTPWWGWILFPLVALIIPYLVMAFLFTGNDIIWRGQKIRVQRGGGYEIIP
jgi:ceramide glucosyltransferase